MFRLDVLPSPGPQHPRDPPQHPSSREERTEAGCFKVLIPKPASLDTLRPLGVILSLPQALRGTMPLEDLAIKKDGKWEAVPSAPNRGADFCRQAFHMHLDNTYASRHPCKCKVGKRQGAMHRYKQQHTGTMSLRFPACRSCVLGERIALIGAAVESWLLMGGVNRNKPASPSPGRLTGCGSLG